jgi:hypothetical protein
MSKRLLSIFGLEQNYSSKQNTQNVILYVLEQTLKIALLDFSSSVRTKGFDDPTVGSI